MDTHTTPEPVKKGSISTGAAIVTAAVIIALALIITMGSKSDSGGKPDIKQPAAEITSVPAEVATIRPTDHVRGDVTKAEIAVIEYSDSDCSFCARFHTTMQQITTEYAGKVAWVYRHFPLTSLHPNAVTEAVALECVAELGGNAAFTSYLDTIINVTLSPDPKSNETLTTFATAQGINAGAFKTCIAGSKASDRVKKDMEEAVKIGAQGTPFSVIVNLKTSEQKIVPGAYGVEEVRGYIDSLLK